MIKFSTPLSAINASINGTNVIANNIANINTTGFKQSRTHQADVKNFGTQISSINRDLSSGSPMLTGDNLNLAIQGDGFFKVQTPSGTAYTRDGNFGVDSQGRLVTAGGNPVTPDVTIPTGAENVTVNGNGEVFATVNGEAQRVGQIELTRFSNPAGLQAAGENLYYPSGNSGQPVSDFPGQSGRGEITQGYLESSNVDLAQNMVGSMINTNAFKANIQVLKTMDEMSNELLKLVG